MSASAVTLSYVMNGADNVLLVEGEIVEGDAQKLEEYILITKGDYEPDFRIALNSGGGNLVEGIKMGLVIRKHNLSTSIGAINKNFDFEKSRVNPTWYLGVVDETDDSMCASACAYAFLGGANRFITSDYKLGLHQFYSEQGSTMAPSDDVFDNALSDAQELMGLLVMYISHLGDVDFNVLVEAVTAKPNDMNWLTLIEAKKLKIISYDNYEDFYLEPYKKGIVAVSRVKDSNSGYDTSLEDRISQATFFCRDSDFILMLSSDLLEDEFNWNYEIDGTWWLEYKNGNKEQFVTASFARIFNSRVYLDIDASFLNNQLQNLTGLTVWLSTARSKGNLSFEKQLSPFEIRLIESTKDFCIN